MIKAKIHPLYNYEIHMYLDDKLLGITWSNTYPEVGGVFEYKSDTAQCAIEFSTKFK
jgi:hypothetical protein